MLQAGGAGARCRGAGQSRPAEAGQRRACSAPSPPSVPLQALEEEEGAGAGTRRLPRAVPGCPRGEHPRAAPPSRPPPVPSRPVLVPPRPRGAHRQAELQVLLRQQQQEPPRRHPPRRRHLGTAPASPTRMRRRAGMAGTAREGRKEAGSCPSAPRQGPEVVVVVFMVFVAVPGPCLPELPR